MNDIPPIIDVDILPDSWDIFWNELPDSVKANDGVNTLIISAHFEDGSTEDIQLQKILQACKLNKEQYQIIRFAKDQRLAWHKLKEAFHPKHVLLFGVMPAQLGIMATLYIYYPNSFDGCIWIPSLSLTEMEQQQEAKKQLWQNALKPVFADTQTSNS
ncbi:MAG: DNA polymerase III subunit psi [Bacteroidetes bacterium]|nr:DNA polymerase III subunit psi [Bacteroidota bacterium]